MSSRTWIRGPVCGVDNCPSRLWRNLNGQRICQYGHINETYVEINDEDGMLPDGGDGTTGKSSGITRRLTNVAGLSQQRNLLDKKIFDKHENDRVFFGRDLKRIMIRCNQFLLKYYSEFIIDKFFDIDDSLKQRFISEVKKNWCYYLKNKLDSKLDNYEKFINIEEILVLVYYSLVRCKLNLNFYFIDFINLILVNKIRSNKIHLVLPKQLLKKLPIFIISKKFDNSKLICLNFFKVFKQVSTILQKHESNDNAVNEHSNLSETFELNYVPFIVKIVLKLRLPIEIINLTNNLILYLKSEEEISSFDLFQNIEYDNYEFPELTVFKLILINIKLYFKNNPKIYLNWIVVNSKYNKDLNFLKNYNDLNLVKNLILKEFTFDKLTTMDSELIKYYLNFFKTNLINDYNFETAMLSDKLKEDVKVSMKRLFGIFDIENNKDDDQNESVDKSTEKENMERGVEYYKSILIDIYTELYDNNVKEEDNDDSINALLSKFDKDTSDKSVVVKINSGEILTEFDDIMFDYFNSIFNLSFKRFEVINNDSNRVLNELINRNHLSG
ncbi:hypothetical protein B5S28_g2773 [[Candida] boidinii]|nr:hypothetical protein B5S28_g2773 [[Candida] boidinii]OWB62785.1 hypothetical protein B5S29_g3730 [[Candida] boidinii]OWB74237.1 hypothetical protein B5S31_g4022 [[Candida] boidinii]OWB78280.1 hypothetical protein B5S32_g2470 [[Candida] boidinii]